MVAYADSVLGLGCCCCLEEGLMNENNRELIKYNVKNGTTSLSYLFI
jgi:hypothetical protein